MTVSPSRLTGFTLMAMLAGQSPAFAHHVMGGKLPETFLQGLLSGLGHPVIGFDHLAAIVGVGLVAALARRGVVPVVAFSAALIAGIALHLSKADVPAGELLVAITTVAIGVVVLVQFKMRLWLVVALFAVAGLVHGYALGESIVGAEPSPLIAYLAGLLIVQTILSVGAYLAALRLQKTLTIAAGALVILAGGMAAAFAHV